MICMPPLSQTAGGRVLLGVPGGVPLRLGETPALDAVCVTTIGGVEGEATSSHDGRVVQTTSIETTCSVATIAR